MVMVHVATRDGFAAVRARDLTRFERDRGERNRQRENGGNPAPHHHCPKYSARAADDFAANLKTS
jgi:hypothetical protein